MSSHPFIRTTRSALDVRNGRRDWFRVRNATSDEAQIDIFDEIGFFGITAKDFKSELDTITADRIQLNINSPGGDVFDAIAIFNMLRDHPAYVSAKILGLGASAASFIPLAAEHVTIARHAQMMIHDAWGLSVGNADDMRRAADFLDRQSGVIADIYADRAGGKAEEWRALMAEETWFTDEEAVAAGLAHEVGSEVAAKNTFDLSVFRNPPRVSPPESPAPNNQVDDQPARPDWRMNARHQVAAALLEV